MKNVLFVLLIGALLSACGNGEESESSSASTNEENAEQTESMENAEATQSEETEAEPQTSSDDPLEVANKNNDYDTLINGMNEEKILYRFVNEDTGDDGMNNITFDDYEVKYALALTEDINGDKSITMMGEQMNNGDAPLFSVEDTEFITDQQEQTTFATGEFGNMDPGIREKTHFQTYLDYEDPESFTMTFYEPLTEQENSEWFSNTNGDESQLNKVELEFHKE
ncbi:hypothetical protein AAV35_012755 [Salimicrobium jeotgali]|uniref:Lipoprotein n=1 Tax=Salimicrobium jeotgali TaxID=1230341 RepID=K2H3M7_9BACI|nr:hypothetical protein [Salimicrobium jeotgali]AKG05533.1 hypothetical protein AAV35_012755 [Salimicrobium jeotgali]EKE30475.1 hypothetical protein MJ3_13579 [Salimicrobium jeotgali]MBM7696623.1 hypothetical protein [Salimicrobium jeotgali]